jgi:hypothetical protein
MYNEEREALTVVRTPIPKAFARAFQNRPPIPLARAVLTPRGIVYYRANRLFVPYTATLATWPGTLMNAVPAITYAGRIDAVRINKAEVGLVPAPATVKADGQTFEVWVTYTNLSSARIVCGVEVRVTRPDLSACPIPAIDWAGQSPNQQLTHAYNIASSPVNQTGNWTAVITLYAQ